MKVAAIITVDPKPDRAGPAVTLQRELFDRLGAHLHSVRLVVPRLFEHACRAAIAETPDLLIAFCDGRLARRVGQIGYDNDIPVGLVCESVRPVWTSRLCCGVAKGAILDNLARGMIGTTRIDAGAAGEHVFFDRAICGAVAHLAEIDSGLAPPGIPHLLHAELIGAIAMNPNVHVRARGHNIAAACALSIGLDAPDSNHDDDAWRPSGLHCLAYDPPAGFERLRAAWNALGHHAWRRTRHTAYFDASQVTVDAGKSIWMSLDGEPMRFAGATRVHAVPGAIEAVGIPAAHAEPEPRRVPAGPARSWNFSQPPRVESALS